MARSDAVWGIDIGQCALKALAGICAESFVNLSHTSKARGYLAHRFGREGGCAWLFNSAGAR